ncbi:MAG TPA: plastocyanin/azurin family copper-binding protein [Candidatus Thermoplasmatota archaeon]|nr:plastocyanin/azurin family copper-binding protein [Candidatus Thermoplasmatota archaeon]
MRLALLLLAALCFAPLAAGASTVVKVMGGYFEPGTLTVAPGDEVTWTNEDSMPHTVTSTWDAGASFDQVLRSGESFTYAFPDAGTFGVHCRPHNGMEMSVTVADETSANIVGPLARTPFPAIAFVILALVGATMLSRRKR